MDWVIILDSLFIFTHIPKTAGMSMYNVLDKQFKSNETMLCWNKHITKLEKMSDEEKNQIKFIKGHSDYGIHEYFPGRKPVYFTMLRDPIDRLVSLYYFVQEPGHEFYHIANGKSIIEFCNNAKSMTTNYQTYMLTKKKDISVNDAISHIEKEYALVGITDMFHESILLLKSMMGWDDVSYEKTNVTKKRKKKSELTDEEREFLSEITNKDRAVYDYFKRKLEENFQRFLSQPFHHNTDVEKSYR